MQAIGQTLIQVSGAPRRNLGPVSLKTIKSSVGPFHVLGDYTIRYPQVVIEALGQLYREYNATFAPLVHANREWEGDYQFCFSREGSPINYGVQIDMMGLDEEFLQWAVGTPTGEVREKLRGMIFEIENSLAMYQLLMEVCAREGRESFFKPRYLAALDVLRQQLSRPIALLAVTQPKYDAMLASEFGGVPNETISDEQVKRLSGFDRFFGPDEFLAYLAATSGKCEYALYARTSDPVTKLKKPTTEVEHPLLGNDEIRRVIKANALTFNIDAPGMHYDRCINDTKGYMAEMGMAFEIGQVADLFTQAAVAHMAGGKALDQFVGQALSDNFVAYLRARNVDPAAVAAGEVHLRAKPAKLTYGCYGHVRGPLSSNAHFRQELKSNLKHRGRYVVQPEMVMPRAVNSVDGTEFAYIDRNFFAIVNGEPTFLGGFRSMLPMETTEVKQGRIHGNGATHWAEVVA